MDSIYSATIFIQLYSAKERFFSYICYHSLLFDFYYLRRYSFSSPKLYLFVIESVNLFSLFSLLIMSAINNERKKQPVVKPSKACLFCGGNHFNNTCRVYSDIISRLKRVKELKLCDRCLAKAHTQDKCKTALKPCFYCKNGSHVTCMCPVQFSQPSNSQVSEVENSKENKTQIDTAVQQDVKSADQNLDSYNADNHSVMTVPGLMCVRITVFNWNNFNISEETGTLLANGIIESYIDEDIAKRLHLQLGDPVVYDVCYEFGNSEKFSYRPTTHTIFSSEGLQKLDVGALQGLSDKLPLLGITDGVESFSYIGYKKPGSSSA
uniref:DM domain-containing protein n=1 Tax=Syphacia muris TaxID=451379 RepID=A0A0N5AB87_9BILA